MGLTEFAWTASGTLKAALVTGSALVPKRLTMLAEYMDFGRWLRQQGLRRRDSIVARGDFYAHINEAILKNCPIDYLEFGVYRGASIKFWSGANRNPESRFFGFDSFEGLPEEWSHLTFSDSAGKFDVQGKIPEIDDSRVSFLKGWFHDSLPPFLRSFEVRNRLVLLLDADLYGSTLFVLTQMSRLLRPGTIVIMDDFSSTSTCVFRAFRDFTSAYGCQYRVLAHGGYCFDLLCVEIASLSA
ncbi:MAG: class I SAM-dependent methyltransferase [Bryobacteraceae bacterium]|nr:class I SAM-dependent methyltransferase [Bryobacteraceae bacterium]